MGALEGFAEEHLGRVEVLARPEVFGATRLVHVKDGRGDEWFVKRLTTPRQWRAESSAYRVWEGVSGVPDLRASCDSRQSLLIPMVSGERGSGKSRRHRRSAGVVLRRLHETPAPQEWASDWRDVLDGAVDRRLAAIAGQDVAVDETLVREHVAELRAYDGPEVATHGNFLPRNWIAGRFGRFHVIDFGAAGRRPAAYDLSRLRYRTCWHDRAGFEDVLRGYGRALTPAEERFLVAMLPWRAVVAISMGLHRGWPEVVRHGLGVLGAVERGQHWGAEAA